MGYKFNIFTRKLDRVGVESISAGSGISIDTTDPSNPIISSSGAIITVVANYAALPTPAVGNTGKFYWASASQGTKYLPGALGGTYYNSGLYRSSGTIWEFIETPYQATQAEVNSGTVPDKFVSPLTLAGMKFLPVLGKLNTTVSSTGVTTEIVLAVIFIPAGTISANDLLELYGVFGATNNANNKQIRIYFNSTTQVVGTVYAPGTSVQVYGRTFSVSGTLIPFDRVFTMKGVINTLESHPTTSSDRYASGALAPTTFTVDFTADRYLIITGQLTVGTDTISLYSTLLKLNR